MARLHPFSALTIGLRQGSRLAILGLFAGASTGDVILPVPVGTPVGGAVFGLFGLFLGVAYGFVRYLAFEYHLGEDTLTVTSGVLNRQRREIPLGRVQSVDVSRGVLQRALGLAVVSIETAGGGGAEATLDAVSAEEAARLRRYTAGDEPVAGEASAGEPLFRLRHRDLFALTVVGLRPGAALAVLFGSPLLDDLAIQAIRSALPVLGLEESTTLLSLLRLPADRLVVAGAVLLALYLLATWAVSTAYIVGRYYGFKLDRVDDELRYEHGLVSRRSGTIPEARIQTVAISETVTMRATGYAALVAHTAGGSAADDGDGGARTTVPLAPVETVYDLADELAPQGDPTFDRPPRRARRRYAVRYSLLAVAPAGLLATLDATVFGGTLSTSLVAAPLGGLVLAPLAGHLAWRNRGVARTEGAFLTRAGFWRRRTRVVPYDRVQTIAVTRSVFQRRLDLAGVVADTAGGGGLVGGDAVAHDRDLGEAREHATALRVELRRSLGARPVSSGGDSSLRDGLSDRGSPTPDSGTTDSATADSSASDE